MLPDNLTVVDLGPRRDEERAPLFEIGQVIGQHIRSGDLVVNPTKRKPGTGHRAAPTGEDEQLPPHRILSLDDAIEYLNADELLEATPGSLRIRKKELKQHLREKVARKAKFAVA